MKRDHGNIPLLHIIKFLSTLYFYQQVLTLYLQSFDLSYVQINSLWGIIVITQAIAEVPSGLFADKFGRKISIILALFLQLSGEIIFVFGNRYEHFVLSATAGGAGFAFLSGSFEALMYDSLKAEGRSKDMQKVAGMNAALGLLAAVIGSSTGGFITAGLEPEKIRLAVMITAIFVFLSCITGFALSEAGGRQGKVPVGARQALGATLSSMGKNRSLLKILLLSLLATPFINYLLNLYPPRFVELGVEGWWFGVTLSLGSLAGFFASRYAYLGEKYMGVRWTVLMATVTPGLLYICLSLVSSPGPAIGVVVIALGSMQIQKPIFLDYINRHVQSSFRATALSVVSLVSGLYVSAMGLLIGSVAERDLRYAFALMGAVIVLSALLIRIDGTHTDGESAAVSNGRHPDDDD